MTQQAWRILALYILVAVVIIAFSHAVLAPAWNTGSAIFYYYFPVLCILFTVMMMSEPFKKLWS